MNNKNKKLLLLLLFIIVIIRGKKLFPGYTFIIREALKWGNAVVRDIGTIYTYLDLFNDMMKRMINEETRNTVERGDITMLLRNLGELWPLALIVNFTCQVIPYNNNEGGDDDDDNIFEMDEKRKEEGLKDIVEFRKIIASIGVDREEVYNEKRVVDGKLLMKELKVKGKQVAPLLEKALWKQLNDPGIGAEKIVEWVKEKSMERE